MKGALIHSNQGSNEGILKLLDEGLKKNLLRAALLPVEVPARDSFAYLLVQDPEILKKACPSPPVMSVQGGKVLRSLTFHGMFDGFTAAVMRPCEARAAVELSNLNQTRLENMLLISYDCPGTVPLSAYVKDPSKYKEVFEQMGKKWDPEPMRPLCRVCENFSLGPVDVHIASLNLQGTGVFAIPLSEKGREFLAGLGYEVEESVDAWEAEVERLRTSRSNLREKAREEWSSTFKGADGLLGALSHCINCHNCQRVCPICYCRQCYFDSEALELPHYNYLARARRKGALRLPSDTLLFHLTRMSHMGLSCVSCGACEDACPMDVPIAQIFSLVGSDAQKLFGHSPGTERGESSPLVAYQDEEFHEVEMPYVETLKAEGGGE